MITVREATLDDVEGVRTVFQAEYADHYAYPQYYDTAALSRLVYADGTILLVAIDSESRRVVGTASVVFSVGAYNDLIGEFGRLVVHPEFRGRGIGNLLMEARVKRVQSRLHMGIVENRVAHTLSQQISTRYGFSPVGFIPMKLLLTRRESVSPFVRYFADALTLRRNNPRIIPEAGPLAGFALANCGLPQDAILDDTSAPYPHDEDFQLDELETEGYASLLRIERGRLRKRDVFGPIRLHYGLFQLRARQSHYLIARRRQQVAGGIGFMIDHAEKVVKIFELISRSDLPIRFLLQALLRKCQTELGTEYIEVDASAYSPRMQRTLLELDFLPVSYTPANVFHEVERLDAVKMARVLVPLNVGTLHMCEAVEPIAAAVLQCFASKVVLPRLATASANTPLFAGLTDEQRYRLLGICQSRTFQPGETIFRQGDTYGTMHLILSGEVDLLADRGMSGEADVDGDQPTKPAATRHVATVTMGQCLGETTLLCAPTAALTHSVTATAKTSVDTANLTSCEFRQLIRRRPDIGVAIYRNLAADVSHKLRQSLYCENEAGAAPD